jgi:hypothetical protein
MSQNDGVKNLKLALMAGIAVNVFYGISFLFFPGLLVSMSGSSEPLNLGWIRWSGGPLLAIGIGGLQAYRKPSGQGVFITVATASALLTGLGLLYSKIFDRSTTYTWFHMTPCVLSLLLVVLLLWARQGAKDILK